MTDTTGIPTQEATDSLPEEPIVSADSSETYSKRIKRYTILTSDETVKIINSSIWSWPIILALTITIALTAIAIYFKIMLLLAAAIALLGTITAWLTFAAYGCGTGIRDYLKDCEIEFSELNDLRVNLFTYLNEIDDRTSRYFHCMPQDLLTVYYRLRQIEAQLTTMLNEADYLCSLKSKYSALQALNILKSPFRYRDSMSINTGTEYEIALYAVPKTIQELVSLLESKLTKLEDDLAVTVFEETPEEVSSESEEDEPKA